MPGPSLTGITGPLLPSFLPSGTGSTWAFLASVTSPAARLGALITVPEFPDALYRASNPPTKLRRPLHVFFQVPIAAANPIYMTFDNNTVPVVGGPGLELSPGWTYLFYNAGPQLMTWGGKTAGDYQVNANTAFQLIAVAPTNLLVTFSD